MMCARNALCTKKENAVQNALSRYAARLVPGSLVTQTVSGSGDHTQNRRTGARSAHERIPFERAAAHLRGRPKGVREAPRAAPALGGPPARPRCDAKTAAGGAYRISRQQPYEAVMSKLS